MYISRNNLNLLIGFLITSSVATAVRKHDPQPTQLNLHPRAACDGFEGNDDFYGLGIRIGIYLQWISSLLTSLLLPTGTSDYMDTNSIFLFAVFIATATATTRNGGLHPAEAFIMLQLCFGFLLSVLSVSGFRLVLLRDKVNLDPRLLLNSATQTNSERMPSIQAIRIGTQGQDIIAKPPQDAKKDLSRSTLLWLRVVDFMAFLTLAPENAIFCLYFSQRGAMLEPLFVVTDLFVLLSLQKQSYGSENAGKVFSKERLLNYKAHREELRKYTNPRLFSLGLTLVFKDDQMSWMGIAWRSSLVGGISIYNVWYWFHGIEFLSTTSCTTYIFFFRKTYISGHARIFFKFLSIGYIIYSGSLILVVVHVISALLRTTYRSLLVNFVIMPYARIMLQIVLLFEGFGGHKLQERFSQMLHTQTNLLNWLGIPSFENLLKAVAYLASNPKGSQIEPNTDIEAREQEKSNRSLWTQALKSMSLFMAVGIIIWSIVTVELALLYNSINGVYTIRSTGQLKPLITGIVGLGKTMHELFIDSIKRKYPDWADIEVSVVADNIFVIKKPNDDLSKPTQSEAGVPAVAHTSLIKEDEQALKSENA